MALTSGFSPTPPLHRGAVLSPEPSSIVMMVLGLMDGHGLRVPQPQGFGMRGREPSSEVDSLAHGTVRPEKRRERIAE